MENYRDSLDVKHVLPDSLTAKTEHLIAGKGGGRAPWCPLTCRSKAPAELSTTFRLECMPASTFHSLTTSSGELCLSLASTISQSFFKLSPVPETGHTLTTHSEPTCTGYCSTLQSGCMRSSRHPCAPV